MCELSKKPDLDWDEQITLDFYNKPVDYNSAGIFFNIAVKVNTFNSFRILSTRIILNQEYVARRDTLKIFLIYNSSGKPSLPNTGVDEF